MIAPPTAPTAVAISHRSDTRDRQQAKAGQKTTDAAYRSADAGTCPGVRGSVRWMIPVISVVDVVRNKANVGVRDAVCLEVIYCRYRRVVGIEISPPL
jgi:hypothetical protein